MYRVDHLPTIYEVDEGRLDESPKKRCAREANSNTESVVNDIGQTNLHLIAESYCLKPTRDHIEAFMEALPASNPMIRDRNGNTAMHLAVQSGFIEAVRALPDACVNIPDNEGKTPLYHAVKFLMRTEFFYLNLEQLPWLRTVFEVLNIPGLRLKFEVGAKLTRADKACLVINELFKKGAFRGKANSDHAPSSYCESWYYSYRSNFKEHLNPPLRLRDMPFTNQSRLKIDSR